MTRPRMKSLRKDADSLRILGREIHKTSLYFIAQVVAFWLLVIGMLVFVWMWYVQNS